MDGDDRYAERFLATLLGSMQRKPREAVQRRHAMMISELKFRRSSDDRRLTYLRQKGWSDSRFYVLFALNCVYQEVLGPLQASARSGVLGLGAAVPIKHGTKIFDRAHSRSVGVAIADFMAMVTKLGFSRQWLTRNTCGDLIFYIERHEREGDRQ